MPCAALSPTGDLAFPMRIVQAADVVAVRVAVRLRTAIGDWITDTALGLPWRDWIENNGPSMLEASGLVRAQLEDTPGVVEVVSCTATQAGSVVSVRAVCRVQESGAESVLTVSSSFDPFATSGAPAWYISTRPGGGSPGSRW